MKKIPYTTTSTSLKDDLEQLESRVSDLETSKGNPKGGEIVFNHFKEDGTSKTFEEFTLDERDSWLYSQMLSLHNLYLDTRTKGSIAIICEMILAAILFYLLVNYVM